MQGPELLRALTEGGYLEPQSVGGRHRRTARGEALERMRSPACYSRAAGERALKAFASRARILLANERSLCIPTETRLFGEMLGEAPRIAAVELAVTLSLTAFGEAQRWQHAGGKGGSLIFGGRSFVGAGEWTTAVEHAAIVFLRGRSPLLEIDVGSVAGRDRGLGIRLDLAEHEAPPRPEAKPRRTAALAPGILQPSLRSEARRPEKPPSTLRAIVLVPFADGRFLPGDLVSLGADPYDDGTRRASPLAARRRREPSANGPAEAFLELPPHIAVDDMRLALLCHRIASRKDVATGPGAVRAVRAFAQDQLERLLFGVGREPQR